MKHVQYKIYLQSFSITVSNLEIKLRIHFEKKSINFELKKANNSFLVHRVNSCSWRL